MTSLMRLAVRLARKEELATTVVQSMRVLLTLKTPSLFLVCRQASFGLHEFLRNNAANVHDGDDWNVIFNLIEIVGAGAAPLGAASAATSPSEPNSPGRLAPQSRQRRERERNDSGHGASSDSESAASTSRANSPAALSNQATSSSVRSGESNQGGKMDRPSSGLATNSIFFCFLFVRTH